MRRLGSILAVAVVGVCAATANAQSGETPPGYGEPPPGTSATCPCPGCPGPGGMGPGHPHGALKDAANVSVENNASGAVVRFQAKSGSPADLEKARQAARIVAKKLETGGCPGMMGPGPEGGPHHGPAGKGGGG